MKILIISKFIIVASLLFSSHMALAIAKPIKLKVTPKLCTISNTESHCETTLKISWKAAQSESLCLSIQDRPEVSACWEDHIKGKHQVNITFDQDLIVELRDQAEQQLIISKIVKVVREIVEFRRKRRQPWDLFF